MLLIPSPATAQALPCLWLARLDAALPPEVVAWLDAGERERLEHTTNASARRSWVVAWSLRRWALTRVKPEVSAAAWRFAQGPLGKPELTMPFAALGLHHSLSHGGDYAAVLVANAPCGVDVEPSAAGLEAAAVAFGPRERAELAAHPRPAERFLQRWVLKEAALKLIGTGFQQSPDMLELHVAPDGFSATPDASGGDGPRLPPGVTLRAWPLPDGHWLAAALSRPADLQPAWAPWSAA